MKKKEGKIRLSDIAKKANVSISSVSRVVRESQNVDDGIRARVEKAMKEFQISKDYFFKKNIISNPMRFIALYIDNFLNPFYSLVVKGIADVTATHNYEIILCNVKIDEQSQYQIISELTKNDEIKGIICKPDAFSPAVFQKLVKEKIPLVVIDGKVDGLDGCFIVVDNRQGVRDAVQYLISLGHRKILYVTDDEKGNNESSRYEGYCEALKSANIVIDPDLKVSYYKFQSAYEKIREKLLYHVEFTAVFCTSDLAAFTVKQVLEDNGFFVPKDISIMGFDDIPFSETICLTTCSRHGYEMGRNTALMLIDLINDRNISSNEVILHPTLNIRKSCRRIEKSFNDSARKIAAGRIIRLGFSPPADTEFYNIIKHGAYTMMNELTERFNVRFEFEMTAPKEHIDIEPQIAVIEKWTSKGFDAILICSAGDITKMNSVYAKAMDKGTAIYLFNMPAEIWDKNELNAVSLIGYNNHSQAGYSVGKYAAEKLNGKGKILLVWGFPGHWANARKEGFLEAIKSYPNMVIIGEERGNYEKDRGMEAAINLLRQHPDTDLIYGENDEMIEGAIQAISTLGLKYFDGKDGIITIGADGLESGFELIRQGKLTATVDVGPVEQGREFIMAVFMHEALGYNVDKIINVPTEVIDKFNVDKVMARTKWALSTNYNKNIT